MKGEEQPEMTISQRTSARSEADQGVAWLTWMQPRAMTRVDQGKR
jgi:hypothetical protein